MVEEESEDDVRRPDLVVGPAAVAPSERVEDSAVKGWPARWRRERRHWPPT